MKVLGLGIKFVGALMSSWAVFSALAEFERLEVVQVGLRYLIQRVEFNPLTTEMIVLAIGLTLLLGNFESFGKK